MPKPPNYWKNPENVEKEITLIIKKLGHFPNSKELNELGYGSLLNKIQKFDGGIVKFRENLGYNSKRLPSGYWKDLDNVKMVMDKLIHKLGHYPSKTELSQMNQNSLYHVIRKYHGGYEELKKRMGYSPTESGEGFINYVENSEVARFVVEKFGNDTVSMIDILSVAESERIPRGELKKLIEQPSLKKWLGNYAKGLNSMKDLAETEIKLLPLDKNGVIEGILKNAALEFMRKKLGPRPSKKEKEEFENNLKASLYAM